MDDHRPLPSALSRAESALSKVAPARSRTDASNASRQHDKDRFHLHRHLQSNSLRTERFAGSSKHHHHHHHHHHSHGGNRAPQSAVESKSVWGLEGLLRSGEGSQRESLDPRAEEGWREAQTASARAATAKIRPEHVQHARELNARRQDELRESLAVVEEAAMSSTRLLDDTYYGILEKASLLRSTVASLQQLADDSRRMHTTFRQDATRMERRTRRSLDAFAGLEQQERTVDALVERLGCSKRKTDELNGRLETARHRVAAYEKRYNEAQAKRRQNWHITWLTLAGLAVLSIAIGLVRRHGKVETQLGDVGRKLVAERVASPVTERLMPSPNEDAVVERMFEEVLK